ncbi:MAG: Maf family protein, partial [Hypericibacter sp.]
MTPTRLDSPRLVLASASPRRLDLLRQIGIEPAVVDAADIDESPRGRELPAAHARRLALAKALARQVPLRRDPLRGVLRQPGVEIDAAGPIVRGAA